MTRLGTFSIPVFLFVCFYLFAVLAGSVQVREKHKVELNLFVLRMI